MKKVTALLLSLAAIVLLFGGCSKSDSVDGILYTSKTLRFSVVLPDSWKGRYVADEAEDAVLFRSKANLPAGVVFQIRRYDKAEWENDGKSILEVTNKVSVIGEGGGSVYTFSTPSDVQYDPADAAKQADHSAMYNDLQQIRDSFTILE